jgi:hypothetical protein
MLEEHSCLALATFVVRVSLELTPNLFQQIVTFLGLVMSLNSRECCICFLILSIQSNSSKVLSEDILGEEKRSRLLETLISGVILEGGECVEHKFDFPMDYCTVHQTSLVVFLEVETQLSDLFTLKQSGNFVSSD